MTKAAINVNAVPTPNLIGALQEVYNLPLTSCVVDEAGNFPTDENGNTIGDAR